MGKLGVLIKYRVENLGGWVEWNYSILFPANGKGLECKHPPLYWHESLLSCNIIKNQYLCYICKKDSIQRQLVNTAIDV